MEEQFTNHSEEVVEETPVTEEAQQETAQEEMQEQTQEAPATTQDNDFFEVKYNKENMRISRDEAPTYIQKGLNYDKVNQKASEYEQHLQKVAQITGYGSIEDLIQASQQFEEQQRVQQEAERLGMDEEAYRQYIAPVNEELTSVKQQLEEMRKESIHKQIDAELNELKKNENFSKYEKETFDLATKFGMSLTEAFEFASLRGLKEQIPSIQQQAEQKVVDQIKSRQGKHVETSDENARVSLNLSPEEMNYAQRMGISPEEYAKWK